MMLRAVSDVHQQPLTSTANPLLSLTPGTKSKFADILKHRLVSHFVILIPLHFRFISMPFDVHSALVNPHWCISHCAIFCFPRFLEARFFCNADILFRLCCSHDSVDSLFLFHYEVVKMAFLIVRNSHLYNKIDEIRSQTYGCDLTMCRPKVSFARYSTTIGELSIQWSSGTS